MILFFLITQMLPSTLVLTSLYIMFSKVGLLNTYWAPILADATLGIPFSIIILRTYFLSIPKELDEAANIDGCGYWKSFFLIMLPIAKPGVVVAVGSIAISTVVLKFIIMQKYIVSGLTNGAVKA